MVKIAKILFIALAFSILPYTLFAQPHVEVTGIIGGENAFAVVNGRVVGVGDMVGEIKIIAISNSDIQYEFDNQIYTKKIGEGLSKNDLSIKKAEVELKKVDTIISSIPKIDVVKFAWEWESVLGESLFSPILALKITNTSSKPLSFLSVKAVFIDKRKKEVLGEDSVYIITESNQPLLPNYSRRVSLDPGVGYSHCLVREKYPRVTAKLYINDEFYKEVRMPLKDWSTICIVGGGSLP